MYNILMRFYENDPITLDIFHVLLHNILINTYIVCGTYNCLNLVVYVFAVTICIYSRSLDAVVHSILHLLPFIVFK